MQYGDEWEGARAAIDRIALYVASTCRDTKIFSEVVELSELAEGEGKKTIEVVLRSRSGEGEVRKGDRGELVPLTKKTYNRHFRHDVPGYFILKKIRYVSTNFLRIETHTKTFRRIHSSLVLRTNGHVSKLPRAVFVRWCSEQTDSYQVRIKKSLGQIGAVLLFVPEIFYLYHRISGALIASYGDNQRIRGVFFIRPVSAPVDTFEGICGAFFVPLNVFTQFPLASVAWI